MSLRAVVRSRASGALRPEAGGAWPGPAGAPLRGRLVGAAHWLATRLWALPWTLVGLSLALLLMLGGGRPQRVSGVVECDAGRIGRWALSRRRPPPWVAITFGHVVLALDRADLAALRDHEHTHVRQYERWGPLFIPAYLAAGAWQWLRGGCAYRDNPFECEACRVATTRGEVVASQA